MSRYCRLILVFGFLFAGMVLLFKRCEAVVKLRRMFDDVKSRLADRDRKTGLEQRRQLYEFERKKSFWISLERQLEYSGLKKYFRGITGAKYIVVNAIVLSGSIVLGWGVGKIYIGLAVAVIWCFSMYAVLRIGRATNMQRVSEDLPKFLDFLGSYSLSAGEVTQIFSQISIYLNSPLRDAIDECVAESSVSGNSGAALLALADKIEHPQFKQLVRNIEMTSRYSADFSSLVTDSRRSLREYLAQSRERKGMLREAVISMMILLLMSIMVIMMVNMLIGGGIGEIILHTFVGRAAVIGVILIVGLFTLQALSVDR